MPVRMHALPAHERPRERLLRRGVRMLTERELIALVLRSGTRGVSALELATELLAEYGDLEQLANARPEELLVRPGIGNTKASSLVAAFELARRTAAAEHEAPVLRRPEDVARIARLELKGVLREQVLVIVCDASNRVRQRVVVSEGSVDRALMPVREILNAVLRHDGRAFAIAHNHPDGDPQPSDADRRATVVVKEAAGVVGLRFLGHVVVADGAWEPVTIETGRTPR
jgi:DNA repair protein RadC